MNANGRIATPEDPRDLPGEFGHRVVIDVRFADTTLIDLAAGGTPVDLEFAYTLSTQAKLVLTASPSSRSRARAAFRLALTSAAPGTMSRAGC